MDVVSVEGQVGQPKCGKAEDEKEAEAVVTLSTTTPEEILEKIFLNLEHFQDFKAVSDAFPQFNRILAPYKPVWAFEKVFPLIFPELDREDILNCRLVCKTWTRVVDGFLQTRPYNRVWERYPLAPSSSRNGNGLCEKKEPVYAPVFQTNLVMKDLGPLCLYPIDKLNKFLREMAEHPSNPFVLRSIELVNVEEHHHDNVMYWNTAFVLLSRVGHHIWNATLSPVAVNDRRHPTFNYRMLRTALTFMPNLKNLCVSGFYTDPYLFYPDFDRKCVLIEYIEHFPLPALRQLEGVENLLPDRTKHGPVMDEILKKCLKLNWISTDILFLSLSNIRNHPHLTRLSLKIDGGLRSWQALCRRLEAPNLARLDLTVASHLKFSTLLGPLRSNFPALEYLNFQFLGKLTDFSEPNLPRFFLEKIKTLEVCDSSPVIYEQLLCNMPSLEYIVVCYNGERRSLELKVEDKDQRLQIRDYILSDSMYQSDIWLKMKHLKSFTIARSGKTFFIDTEITAKNTYTRDQYNLQQRKARE